MAEQSDHASEINTERSFNSKLEAAIACHLKSVSVLEAGRVHGKSVFAAPAPVTCVEGRCEFDDVAVHFSEDEWESLTEGEKILYVEVMMENYQTLKSLGWVSATPPLISTLERGEKPYTWNQQEVAEIECVITTDMEGNAFEKAEDQNMPLEFVKSSKGSDLLVVDGCIFRQEKVIHGKRIWKCIEYTSVRCNSRCHTIDGVIAKGPTEHNHVPDVARLQAKRIISDMKQRAVVSQDCTDQIVATTALMAPEATCLPSFSNMKQLVRRVRQKNQTSLEDGNNPDCFPFTGDSNITLKGDRFLLYDSGPSLPRYVIFSTEENLHYLATCKYWYADGTFKSAPPLFKQLYTIHAVKYNNVIPLVFVLMSETTSDSYLHVLTELKNLCPKLRPLGIMTGFDKVSLAAIQRVFPDCLVQGCLFHFSRCLWCAIQQIPGVATRYTIDSEYAFSIRSFLSLAFVPAEHVVSGFEELVNSLFFEDNMEELNSLIEYFEDTWVGRPGRRGLRSKPFFDLESWNCYSSALNDLPKTNYAIEGWHKSFNHLIATSSHNIWKFMNRLKKEQSMSELRMQQNLTGQQALPAGRRPRDIALKLKVIAGCYDSMSLLDYLKNITLHVNFSI